MLSEYTDKIYLMVEWFCRAKEVAIEAESMDNTGYVQPLHEQRYCLDHFIRVINYEKENKKDNKQLIENALNSAISHLQRCYSDCIEWMLIVVVDEYETMLSGYTTQQICIGFPEYYERIRPDEEQEQENQNKKAKKRFFRKNTFSNNNWRNWGSCCGYYNQFLLSVHFGNPIAI